jgi:peptidoglycan/xylan/chitin deacetylase (PgdA/CDA1 family)
MPERQRDARFSWPPGVRAALSFSFDDARPSQLDVALPILDSKGVKATFYILPDAVEKRLEDWRACASGGHEIGNHTMTHPCSANFSWSRSNALEDYTLARIETEILDADARIQSLLGVKPRTFAYPCGQKFVGRGEATVSYVPLVAGRFVVGRGAYDEQPNAPDVFDLAQAFGHDADHPTLAEQKARVDRASAAGGWLILFAHDVAAPAAPHAMGTDVLEGLIDYARSGGVWLDTVAAVGEYVARQQSRQRRS